MRISSKAKDRLALAELIFISILGKRNYGTLSKIPSNFKNGAMLAHFFVPPEEHEPLVKMDLRDCLYGLG